MKDPKIDKRVKYRIVMDTETCPIDPNINKVDPANMLTYDIGWVVTDKRGKVYESHSYVVSDIYYGEKNKLNSAYYADKLPHYEFDIAAGTRIVDSFRNIRAQLISDMEKYHIDEVFAHNARFDCGTLNRTMEYLTNGHFKWFFPYGITICDTLKMARDVIHKMPTYKSFAIQHGLLTKTGKLSGTAESLYKFIIKDPTFVESHTALEDVLIEKEIMAYCYKQKKKMRRVLYAGKGK